MILIYIFLLTIVTSTSDFINYKKKFNDNLKKPISVTVVARKFGNTFENLLNYTGADDRNNSLLAFKYLYDGFAVMDNLTFNYTLPMVMEESTHRESSIEIFLDTLMSIKDFHKNKFIDILGNFDRYYSTTVLYFVNKTLHSDDFKRNLETLKLYTTVEVSQAAQDKGIKENIFRMFFERYKRVKPNSMNCNAESLSHLLFNLYEDILTSVIGAYTVIIISYEFEHVKTGDYVLNKSKQLDYLSQYWRVINNVKKSASRMISLLSAEYREYKNCDPIEWKEGDNYFRVKNYVSSSLEVIQLNNSYKSKSEVDPEFECEQYTFYSNFFDNIVYGISCPQIFEINPSNNDCQKMDKEVKNIFTVPDHENWSVKCTFIDEEYPLSHYCNCDKFSDREVSLRTFSLREQLTDSNESFVVTGIRFITRSNLITIQLQEGRLVDGTVDLESVRWRTDRGKMPDNGVENVTLNYYVKSFNLDDIEVPDGQFVTGVKFNLVYGHLSLAVRGTEMWNDLKSWPSVNHKWYESSVNVNEERLKIDIKDFKNSAEIEVNTKELSKSQRDYIDLTVGLYSNTFNNLPVIPFFDSQDVVTHPPAPIAGIGLFYKGQPSYGGFLAFKFIESKFIYKL